MGIRKRRLAAAARWNIIDGDRECQLETQHDANERKRRANASPLSWQAGCWLTHGVFACRRLLHGLAMNNKLDAPPGKAISGWPAYASNPASCVDLLFRLVLLLDLITT